jgi:hypothetical protein
LKDQSRLTEVGEIVRSGVATCFGIAVALNSAGSKGPRSGAWNVPAIKRRLGRLNIPFPARKLGLWRHHAEPFILTVNPNQVGG